MGQLQSPSTKHAPTATTRCLSTHHSFTTDKLALNVGDQAQVEINGMIKECNVQNVSYHESPLHSRFTDIITVSFNNTTKRLDRYKLRCTPSFLQKRHKLTINCMVDIYDFSLKKWIPAYIDKYGTVGNNIIATNGNTFSVNGMNFDRWCHRIRCCSQLLSLSNGSIVFIFDAQSTQWIKGKIIRIQSQQHLPLSVYIVQYEKNGSKYLKTVHEFSASLASMDCDEPSSTESSVTDENIARKKMDPTDFMYHRMLFERFSESDIDINDDVLCLLIQYVGFHYNLVMAIESKTCCLALQYRDNIKHYAYQDMHIQHEPIHNESSADICNHPLHSSVKKKLIKKGQYTVHNVMKVLKYAEQRLSSFPLVTKQNVDDHDVIINDYQQLPFPTAFDLERISNQQPRNNGYDSGDTVNSLESGCNLELQSDFDT